MPVNLDWDGCPNARDLGGLPADGGRVAYRSLVRSDDLTNLTAAGREAVDAYDPSLVLDLRFPHEVQAQPHPYAAHAAYRHVPFLAESVLGDSHEQDGRDHPLEWTYAWLLDASAREAAAAARAVARAGDGPVVIHCVSGKDRTGLLVAMLLDLAGVERELIGADYALTEARLGLEGKLQDIDEADHVFWRTPPSAVLGALDHLDRRYGGAAAYLASGGLDEADLARLTRRLLERRADAVDREGGDRDDAAK